MRYRTTAAVLLAALLPAGCAHVGDDFYDGASATYGYLRGEVFRTYPCTSADARLATRAALLAQGLAVERDDGGQRSGIIESHTTASEAVTVNIDAISTAPAGLPATRIGVRISTFDNDSFARRLLDQISVRLPPPPPPTGLANVGTPPTGITPPPVSAGPMSPRPEILPPVPLPAPPPR